MPPKTGPWVPLDGRPNRPGAFAHGTMGADVIPESRLPAFTEWTLRARDPYERAGAEPYGPGPPP